MSKTIVSLPGVKLPVKPMLMAIVFYADNKTGYAYCNVRDIADTDNLEVATCRNFWFTALSNSATLTYADSNVSWDGRETLPQPLNQILRPKMCIAHQFGCMCVFLFQSLKGAGIVPVKSRIDPESGMGPLSKLRFWLCCQCAVTESFPVHLGPLAWSWLPGDFLGLLFLKCFRKKMVGATGIEPVTAAVWRLRTLNNCPKPLKTSTPTPHSWTKGT